MIFFWDMIFMSKFIQAHFFHSPNKNERNKIFFYLSTFSSSQPFSILPLSTSSTKQTLIDSHWFSPRREKTVPIFWHLNTQPKTRLFFNKILIQCMLVPKRKWMAEHHCNLNDEYMYIRQCGVVGQGGLNIYTWGSLRRQRYCWNFIIQYHFRN